MLITASFFEEVWTANFQCQCLRLGCCSTRSGEHSVERERLRERDREARVKMTYEAEQRATQDAFSSPPIFGEIVRVKSNDKVRMQIEGKLGRFDEVKHLLDQDLYGIDGQPPPSPAPSGGSSSNNSTTNAHEFKKPNACSQIQPSRSSSHHHHHHHSGSQRSGNVKPADGKPAYGGRGFYPGQPVTTSSISSNAFRSSGMVPGKGPPSSSSAAVQSGNSSSNSNSSNNSNSNGSSINSGNNTSSNSNSSSGGSNSISSHHSNNSSSSSNSSSNSRSSTSHEFSSKLHASARNLPKLNCEPREPSLLSSTLSTSSSTGGSQANVENILDEMTSAVRTPLTAIAATPRPKESESKFTFNPVSGKMESLSPIKPLAADKNSRANLLKEILAPVSQVPISASVFKTGKLDNPITPLTSPSHSPATDSTTIVPSKSKSSNSSVNSASTVSTAATSSSKTASTSLPYNVKNVILSEEDSEDDDDDNDDDDDSEEESSSRKSAPSELSKKVEPAAPVTLENSTNKSAMPVEEERASSSSDDSEESDSGSDSEDSSSDSPSPPSLPAPELPSQEDSKRWNRLKNFMLPTAHGNSTPTPQTPQAGENSEKSKTDDSDSSTTHKSQNASSSSSDSDAESVKSSRDKSSKSGGRKVIPSLSSDDSSDDDDEDDKQTPNHRKRRKHQQRPSSASSASCSSDDSDDDQQQQQQQQQQRKKKLLKGQPAAVTAAAPKTVGANASSSAANTGGSNPNMNNPSMTVVGVVRPHQRRPPSPPAYESTCRLSPQTTAEERYGSYVQQQQQQRSLSMSTASELPSHADGDGIMGRVGGHGRLSNAFQAQHVAASAAVRGGKAPVNADKAGPAAGVANQSTKSNKGRKPKSPAMATADSATRVKKKPGRKRTKIPELSDSEDEEQRKAKVPERKRPGRPPLKRADPDDVEWTAGSRKKILEKFPANNVWGDSQRRRSSLRSSFTPIDSDSDEQSMAPAKPTARVIPAIYKKESSGGSTISGGCSSRVNRDSSCDSAPNDTDYGLMSSGGAKSGGTGAGAAHLHHHGGNNVTKAEDSPPKLVVGIPVQDKKKSDTLRKLFSRPQEGGGKGGGKGKGGKGKCGVIVMESETERKMLQRSMSPASGASTPGSLHRLSDRLADIPRDSLTSSPLQRSPRVGSSTIGSSNKSGCGLSGDTRTSSRRQDRVPEMDSPNAAAVPTTPSTSVDPPISLPKLVFNEQGRPSLMCKIDLSRIPYIVAKKRSEEMRIRSDLPDTRQQQQQPPPPPVVDVPPSSAVPPVLDMVNVPVIEPMSNGEENDAIDRAPSSSNNNSNVGCNSSNTSANSNSSSRAKRLSTKKSKTGKRKHHARDESPTSPPPSSQIFKSSSSAAHTPSVDPQSDSSSSDSEPRKKSKSQRLLARTAADSMHNLISPCYQLPIGPVSQNSMCVDQGSDEESWRSDVSSCISCSSPPLPLYGNHNSKRPSKNHLTSRSWNKRRSEHSQRHTSLTDATSSLLNVPTGSYDRSIPDPTLNAFQIADLVRPVVPTHHGIYYSYLEHKASEETNAESDTVSPNVYLSEAKKLKYAADMERDRVAQGMKYLEAILSFLLTGHVLERKNQMDTAFSMYSETLKVIVYISSRFRQLSANSPQSSIPNKIAVLSLRCESILNLKLFMMRDVNCRDIHNSVNDYFSKSGPMEACVVPNQNIPSPPTPSPASSVGSNSSGYSSGDRRTSAMTPCIMVPVNLHKKIQQQHDLFTNLLSSHTYWEEADKLIFSGGSKDFFIELDRFCGPLTLHSSLKDLVHYVRVGIQRLKAIISHHQRV